MDKIKELLLQIGASEEIADQILGEMNSWHKTQREQLDEQFRGRLERAKQVCVEEVEGYKREVARKVEIFLESKTATIERGARERHAIEESKAANLLKQTKSLLEGIEIDGSEDLQAISAENEKLRHQVVSVTGERDNLQGKYKHAHGIAEKALRRNQVLESKITSGTEKPAAERSKKGTKLEESRSTKGQTKTTRPVLTESQVPAKRSNKAEGGSADISSIANAIPEIA